MARANAVSDAPDSSDKVLRDDGRKRLVRTTASRAADERLMVAEWAKPRMVTPCNEYSVASLAMAKSPCLCASDDSRPLVPKGCGHTVSGLLRQRRHDVAIDVGRRPHLAVPEQLHHDPWMYPGGQ